MHDQKPAGGADGSHDGDTLFIFPQKCAQSALNSDSGKQQRKDTDQSEKKNKVVKRPLDSRFCGPVGGDPFVRGYPCFQIGKNRVHVILIRHFDKIPVTDAASFFDQVERIYILDRDKHPGAEGIERDRAIRFLDDPIGNRQKVFSDLYARTDFDIETIQQ